MGRKSIEKRVYKRQNKRKQRKMAKPLDLAAKCAILNDELLKKNLELEALKANLQTKVQAFEESEIALQNGESRMRESRISQLKKEIGRFQSSLKTLKAKCAQLNDDLLKKKSELAALNRLEPENAKAASRAAEAATTPPDMTNDPEANEIPSISDSKALNTTQRLVDTPKRQERQQNLRKVAISGVTVRKRKVSLFS
ncbi:hypothetical protein Ddc_22470 [Ditylenchus destructor]|nr:hypothetical protein Ddc_22470 [Ditylenchus destructor]